MTTRDFAGSALPASVSTANTKPIGARVRFSAERPGLGFSPAVAAI
jgi:hypothetical protein